MYKNIEKQAKLNLKDLVAYQPGQVVSKTLVQNDKVSMTFQNSFITISSFSLTAKVPARSVANIRGIQIPAGTISDITLISLIAYIDQSLRTPDCVQSYIARRCIATGCTRGCGTASCPAHEVIATACGSWQGDCRSCGAAGVNCIQCQRGIGGV